MDEGDDEGGDDDPDEEEESASAKAEEKARKAKGKAEAAKHRAKAAEHDAKSAALKERAKKCEDDGADSEEAEAEAALAIEGASASLGGATPGATPGAHAALAAQAALVPGLVARVEALTKRAATDDRESLVAAAFAAKRITPAERKTLGTKSVEFVREYLSMRTTPVLPSSDAELNAPKVDATGVDLGPDVLAEVEAHVQAASAHFAGDPAVVAAKVTKLRADMIANARAALNGAAPGRY
jgi:hypothetical protein